MSRLKVAVINCLFVLAAMVATAPIGALAILSGIMERIDRRVEIREIRRAERAFNRAAKKPWSW